MEEHQHRSKWIIVGVSLIIACIIGIPIGYLWQQSKTYAWTNDAQIQGDFVNISPDILARITSLNVDEGDCVSQGQPIAQLDQTLLLPKRNEAAAEVAVAEDGLKFAQSHFEKVRNDYYRAIQAIDDHIISAQEYDHREKRFKMAEAALEKAGSDLQLAKKRLEFAEAHLEHTTIVAPRSGMIAKRWVLAGDVMSPAQTMFTLYDLDAIWILARLNETSLKGVRIGSPVEIRIDAYPGYLFTGKVTVIKSAAASQFSLIPQDNATGNYTKVEQRIPIKISIERPDNFPETKPLYLFPGMSAEVWIRI